MILKLKVDETEYDLLSYSENTMLVADGNKEERILLTLDSNADINVFRNLVGENKQFIINVNNEERPIIYPLTEVVEHIGAYGISKTLTFKNQ